MSVSVGRRPGWKRRSGAYSEITDHLYTEYMHVVIKFDRDIQGKQRHLIKVKLTPKGRSECESSVTLIRTAYVTDDHNEAKKMALERVDAHMDILKQEIRHALMNMITEKGGD
ncbi:MAG: hypothetical protein HDQ88_08885 [Clostridia bacterium]|nr:hypothetical protein [Clostridia bacterium]